MVLDVAVIIILAFIYCIVAAFTEIIHKAEEAANAPKDAVNKAKHKASDALKNLIPRNILTDVKTLPKFKDKLGDLHWIQILCIVM
ncbi:hypothetical protein KEM55_005977, partial [Ascosphaera atra]